MYNYSFEKVLNDLKQFGFAELPSIKSLLKNKDYLDLYKEETKGQTYKENSAAHLKLINDMGLDQLFSALHLHGCQLGLKCDLNNKYMVSRYVKNGQSSEGYRGHFDSHLFTIVLPVVIPKKGNKYQSGELFAIPMLREFPSSEIYNIFQKLYYKKLNRPEIYKRLVENGTGKILNFRDYKPFIFYGNRTFHGNFPLQENDSDRLTFLCHLYDTSPVYGIGSLLRKLRRR